MAVSTTTELAGTPLVTVTNTDSAAGPPGWFGAGPVVQQVAPAHAILGVYAGPPSGGYTGSTWVVPTTPSSSLVTVVSPSP